MNKRRQAMMRCAALRVGVGGLAICLVAGGCQDNARTGAAMGGTGGAVAGGATAGAAAGAPAAGVGAAVGAAVGAVGGAIVGSAKDRSQEQRARAAEFSASHPALASAVISGGTADLNNDGFVTIDEIVAMSNAKLSDDEIIARCRATQQIFQLSRDQEKSLLDAGVSRNVVQKLRTLNADLAEPREPREPPEPPEPRPPQRG